MDIENTCQGRIFFPSFVQIFTVVGGAKHPDGGKLPKRAAAVCAGSYRLALLSSRKRLVVCREADAADAFENAVHA